MVEVQANLTGQSDRSIMTVHNVSRCTSGVGYNCRTAIQRTYAEHPIQPVHWLAVNGLCYSSCCRQGCAVGERNSPE